MPSYIYIVTRESRKRGYNRNIKVYRIRNNKPEFLCDGDFNTASYRGDRPSAEYMIAKEEGYKMNGYFIARKDVIVTEV